MRITKYMLAATLMAACVGVAACEKEHPPVDEYTGHESGLQSRDLVEMTDRFAPDLLQIPQIAQNPTRVVIVMKPMANNTVTHQGEDMTIFVQRLADILNSGRTRDRLAFTVPQAQLRQYQNEELSSPNPADNKPIPDLRQLPQYVLTGTISEHYEGKSSYYLCDFELDDIHTGIKVWSNFYETKTLNFHHE